MEKKLNDWLKTKGRGNIIIVLEANALIKRIDQKNSKFCCDKFNEAGKEKEIILNHKNKKFYKVECWATMDYCINNSEIDKNSFLSFPILGEKIKKCPYCKKKLRISYYDPIENRRW